MVPEGTLIAIDPGKYSGVATFLDGTLTAAWLVEEPWDPLYVGTARVICEEMQIRHRQKKGGGDDLLKVSQIAGRLTANAPRVKYVKARTWKGTIKKEIMLKRILERLCDSERARLPKLPKGKLHNVIDAVGLGLYELGRLR